MSESVHTWLAARADGVPEALQTAIRDAVALHEAETSDLSEVLRTAAHRVLATVVDGGHDDALALLTADALMTYVCEVVSERDPAGLARLS